MYSNVILNSAQQLQVHIQYIQVHLFFTRVHTRVVFFLIKLYSTCLICVCDDQGPDLTLEQFLKIVEECCLCMVNAVKLRYVSFHNKEFNFMNIL